MTFNEVREEYERQEDIEYGSGRLALMDYIWLENMCIDAIKDEYGLNEKQAMHICCLSFLGVNQSFLDRVDFVQNVCRVLKDFPFAE